MSPRGLLLGFDAAGLAPKTANAIEDLIAAMQPSFGRFDASGRWVSPIPLSSRFQIAGAGNSWNVGSTSLDPVAYFLINDTTMCLEVGLAGTVLTVAVPTNIVTIQIPDDYRIGGVLGTVSTPATRKHQSACWIVNNGISFAGVMSGMAGADSISVSPADGSSFVTSSDFAIGGQLLLDVTRKGF